MKEHDYVNEIRSKTDIVEIISNYIPLIQKGKNYFGICPFHDDNNPSMSVSRDIQIYKCFSCGASGNVFNFVMNYEHLSFAETLKKLADLCHVELKNITINNKTDKYDLFYKIYNITNKIFQNNLNAKNGENARNYLKQRQITDDMIKEFEIGFSLNEKDALTKALKDEYDLKILNNIGLASMDHDTYINRITFPLHDLTGKVVGFSGRIYDNSNMNKYLNTKETPIFKKGELLYNYHRCKEDVRIKKKIIVMEGFMDVIRSSNIGIKNTVALMGTSMTKEQAQLIKRLSNEIILCFDGDEAGRKATLVNGEILMNLGCIIKVIALPNDLDPDTYILNKSKESFLNLIDSSINFTDYKIQILKNRINIKSEEEIANYINSVLLEISKNNDEIRHEIILKNLAKEFDIGYNTLDKRFKEILSKKENSSTKLVLNETKKGAKQDKYNLAIFRILYYMLINDKVIMKIEKEQVVFPNEIERLLATEITYYYKKNGIINIADFFTYLSDKKSLFDLLARIIEMDIRNSIEDNELEDYFKLVREYNVNNEIKRLKKLIKEELDPISQIELAERIRSLKIGS